MHTLAGPALVRRQDAWAALALEFKLLHLFAKLLIQRFESIFLFRNLLSAVRA